jgi:hypothetical protein
VNPRERMRSSNRKAVLWLLKNNYDEVWLKSHTRRSDLVYTRGEWYRALDLWNLFDGICFDDNDNIVFIQIKTNAWAKEKPLISFANTHKNVRVLSINVKQKKDKKWEVLYREYSIIK